MSKKSTKRNAERYEELRYNDVKLKNNTVTIKVACYASHNIDNKWHDQLLVPFTVKAVKPTKAEIKKFGTLDNNEDSTGVMELCRLNLTKWHIVSAPVMVEKYAKKLVGKDIWCYWNGASRVWKPYNKSIMITNQINNITMKKINEYENALCYEPHVDEDNNYGDESIHAVYDMKYMKEIKSFS